MTKDLTGPVLALMVLGYFLHALFFDPNPYVDMFMVGVMFMVVVRAIEIHLEIRELGEDR